MAINLSSTDLARIEAEASAAAVVERNVFPVEELDRLAAYAEEQANACRDAAYAWDRKASAYARASRRLQMAEVKAEHHKTDQTEKES